MLNVKKTLCAGAMLVLAAGCDKAEDSGAQSDEFLQAVPSAQELALAVGDQDQGSGQALVLAEHALSETTLGQPAEFQAMGAKVSGGTNSLVEGVLALVKEITEYPATVTGARAKGWGPWTDTAQGVEYYFAVRKRFVPANAYGYVLWMRPAGSTPADWKVALAGVTFRGADNSRREGRFVVSFDNIRTVNTATQEGGVIYVGYDLTEHVFPHRVRVGFSQFEGQDNPGEPFDALYAYQLDADGGGKLGFVAEMDIHKDDVDAAQKQAKELFGVLDRWQADGQGQAHAMVTGGDLGLGAYLVKECWSSELEQHPETYRVEAYIGPGQSLVMVGQQGDKELCPFAEATDPTQVEIENLLEPAAAADFEMPLEAGEEMPPAAENQ